MSNPVPIGWSTGNLGEYATIKGGKRLPKGETFSVEKTDFPYVRVTDFKNGTVALNDLRYVTDEIREKIKRYVISSDDLYISIAGTLGLVGEIPTQLNGALLTENAAKIIFKDCAISDKSFYKFYLNSGEAQDHFHQAKGTGGGVPKLALFRIEDTPILAPPLPEQQKIATILSSVDEVIEKTQAQIDKLKDLKTGMMQELLTKGIGHTEFKDSPVGSIPVEWEVERFDSLCVLQRGFDLPVQSRSGGDVPIFGSNGIVGYNNEPKVTGANVITGRSGSIGDVMYFEGDCWPLNTSLYIREFYDNHPKFVYYFLHNFDLKRFGTGTGVPTLNRNDVHLVQIAIPSIDEQIKISNSLSSVDDKLTVLDKKFIQLTSTKKALMQDLLTGKVRVTLN